MSSSFQMPTISEQCKTPSNSASPSYCKTSANSSTPLWTQSCWNKHIKKARAFSSSSVIKSSSTPAHSSFTLLPNTETHTICPKSPPKSLWSTSWSLTRVLMISCWVSWSRRNDQIWKKKSNAWFWKELPIKRNCLKLNKRSSKCSHLTRTSSWTVKL